VDGGNGQVADKTRRCAVGKGEIFKENVAKILLKIFVVFQPERTSDTVEKVIHHQ
jgi:hypothetical protein